MVDEKVFFIFTNKSKVDTDFIEPDLIVIRIDLIGLNVTFLGTIKTGNDVTVFYELVLEEGSTNVAGS